MSMPGGRTKTFLFNGASSLIWETNNRRKGKQLQNGTAKYQLINEGLGSASYEF